MVIEPPSRKHPHAVVFHDASWDFYRAMNREYAGRPHRTAYSRRTLEVFTTLTLEHEHLKEMLGVMVGLLALEFRIPMTHGGSSTLKRLTKRKGLEADQCYWIANEPAVRTKKRLNLKTDPPPDLVIEIDVMHSVVNREKIYAALGFPRCGCSVARASPPLRFSKASGPPLNGALHSRSCASRTSIRSSPALGSTMTQASWRISRSGSGN